MRLLLFNPNATERVTRSVLTVARAAAGADVELSAATSRRGPAYISSRETIEQAAAEAERELLALQPGFDACVLACFGDPGLLRLKALLHKPVIGLLEAACAVSRGAGWRSGIVTGGSAWADLLPEIVADLGYTEQLFAVATIETTGGQVAGAPEVVLDELVGAARDLVDRGADSIIVGGAAFSTLTATIAGQLTVPVIDPIRAAMGLAQTVVSSRLG